MADKHWLGTDAGSLGGKIHAETLRKRFAIPAIGAEKSQKPDAIRDMRGRLMAGRLMVLEGAQNDAIRSEWRHLGWKNEKREHGEDRVPDGPGPLGGTPDATAEVIPFWVHDPRGLG